MKEKVTLKSVLKNFDAILASTTLLICVILVNANIIMRYFFHAPITWAEETVTSLFVWTAFIGSAYAYRKHEHLGVDILVKNLPEGTRRVISSVMAVVELLFLIMLTVISAQYVYHLIFNRRGEFDPVLTDLMRVPKWWTGIAVPLGFGLSTYHSVRFMFHRFRGITADDELAEEGGDEA
ncbi:MAG: TRAP transporter small permease [Oscillospiraceae bacterium]|nr:TRAP transporter small permease [Oscillospiraceae bacterium]